MQYFKNKTVLVCPLDWGLGHASRDVSLINDLLSNNCKVIIGADNAPLFFLRKEFPELDYIKIPSVKIKYPEKASMFLQMFFLAPKIIFGIAKEHFSLKKILKTNKIDLVISDNRFGLWNKNVETVFITHQLRILMPENLKFLETFVFKINMFFIKKYNHCFIPDFEGESNLSGKLSHNLKLPLNAKFIGILSRFKIDKKSEISENQKFEILAIISGPEPQRTIFENILISQIKKTNYKALIVRGKPLSNPKENIENIVFENHLSSEELQNLIVQTPVIISRSGYSTIMDLVSLNKKAILVPTPKQTEQEYLSEYLKSKNIFYTVSQKDFDLEKVIKKLKGIMQIV
ncbi:MAG: hypothetical protein JXA16_04565 [Bacteroidales bacterium]|nr:hypothetical protein [Bacteroidales bacterium]